MEWDKRNHIDLNSSEHMKYYAYQIDLRVQ